MAIQIRYRITLRGTIAKMQSCSCRQKAVRVEADWTSSGRLYQIHVPEVESGHSHTETLEWSM